MEIATRAQGIASQINRISVRIVKLNVFVDTVLLGRHRVRQDFSNSDGSVARRNGSDCAIIGTWVISWLRHRGVVITGSIGQLDSRRR